MTPYCYCRRIYNAELSMLACDSCNEWYHHECVGLTPPPEGNDAAGDSARMEYVCPSCMMKGGKLDRKLLAKLPALTQAALQQRSLGTADCQLKEASSLPYVVISTGDPQESAAPMETEQVDTQGNNSREVKRSSS